MPQRIQGRTRESSTSTTIWSTEWNHIRVLKPGGILVSVVSPVLEATQKLFGVRTAYFYVDVTAARLNKITELFDSGKLVTDVGTLSDLIAEGGSKQ